MNVERISSVQLLALHMMANSLKEKSEFYADVYAAVSELIERREAAGEWRGLADDGKVQDERV